jgi:hypothetical protein
MIIIGIILLSFGIYYNGMAANNSEKYESIKDYKYECSFENVVYYEENREAIGYGTLKLTPFDELQLIEIIHFGRDGVYLGNNKTKEELFKFKRSRDLEAEKVFTKDFEFIFYQNNQDIYYTECLYDREYGYYHICHGNEAEFLNEEHYNGIENYYCLTNVYNPYYKFSRNNLLIFGFIIVLPFGLIFSIGSIASILKPEVEIKT